MTAMICLHRPEECYATWITCGAPNLMVIDDGKIVDANPDHRGGMPIGLMPDTVYGEGDVVTTRLSKTAVCVAYTDGILDVSKDAEGSERLPVEVSHSILKELASEAREKGYWCHMHNWPEDAIGYVQLVLEEKVMNVYDHGFDDRTRLHEVVSVRLSRRGDSACLTVWDNGTPEPSIAVVAGDSALAFDMANNQMSNHGRGRLMVRELCEMVQRNQCGTLNETVYHIPFVLKAGADPELGGGVKTFCVNKNK